MDLCLDVYRRPGSRVSKWWWYQEVLELEGMRAADQGEEQEELEEDTDGTAVDTDE